MNECDVVIVGGGAAGLSAALVLARACRSVVVIDTGRPRNSSAAHMHGFLGSDGLPRQSYSPRGPPALCAAGSRSGRRPGSASAARGERAVVPVRRWWRPRNLNRVLLASVRDQQETLSAILQEARTADDQAATVTALDAQARLAATAGKLEAARAHLDEADAIAPGSGVQEAIRVDAATARAILAR